MEYIKGPWKIGPHNNPKIGCVDIGDTGYVVCCLKDDAQLIAAAPDMYEALKMVGDYLETDAKTFAHDHDDMLQIIYNVIATAEGGQD